MSQQTAVLLALFKKTEHGRTLLCQLLVGRFQIAEEMHQGLAPLLAFLYTLLEDGQPISQASIVLLEIRSTALFILPRVRPSLSFLYLTHYERIPSLVFPQTPGASVDPLFL